LSTPTAYSTCKRSRFLHILIPHLKTELFTVYTAQVLTSHVEQTYDFIGSHFKGTAKTGTKDATEE